MVKLNPVQEAALEQSRRDWEAFESAQRTLGARLRAEMERQLVALETAASLSFNRAKEAGVPIARLAVDAMHNTNRAKVRALIALTSLGNTAPTADAANPAERYVFDHESQTITITAVAEDASLYQAAREAGAFGWTLDQIEADEELHAARFRVEGGHLDPITPDWLVERADRHPVVALHTTPDLERAALEWARTQPGFLAAERD